MNAVDTGRLIERYFAAWNSGDLDAFDDLVAADYVNHSPSTLNPPPGPAGLRPIVAAMRTAFDDLHYDILRMVIDGDLVAVHLRVTGTNTGPFFGAPPTGRRVEVAQMQFEQVRDGRIVQHWRVTEDLALG